MDKLMVELPRMLWKNQPVVTGAMIDRVHGRQDAATRKAFNAHRDKLVAGEDYFVLNMDEAQNLGIVAPNGLTLFTETGYATIIKTFEDARSWRIYREFVRFYFRVQEAAQPVAPTLPDFTKPAVAA